MLEFVDVSALFIFEFTSSFLGEGTGESSKGAWFTAKISQFNIIVAKKCKQIKLYYY